ncbi:M20 family metallopeptidase [Micromonospora sp. NPDC047740]|uniref:M20 family metallopeptidase n=1 Tax=Micromonospora sp. NPDC047740 TaxID=3364254 RepID=UPI003717275E
MTMIDVVDLLAELVAQNTTNPVGNETAAAGVLADVLRAAGFEVRLDEISPGRANLIARADFSTDGPTVMLNSHLDVVPAGAGWTSSPFILAQRDGRLYGRGAADAKGSLAAMAVAAVNLVRQASRLRGSLVYTAVADEEVGSLGARRLLSPGSMVGRPDAAIVGEPTGLRLCTAHKGSVRPVIEVTGVAAHAATPQQGVNAISSIGALLRLVDEYAGHLAGRAHPLVGPPTVTPVLIDGGEAPNAVPERCRITLDRRLVPGERAEVALAEVRHLLTRFDDAAAPARAEIAECAPSTGGPSETPADHPFVVTAQRALAAVGLDSKLAGLVVNCDMTHFRTAGIPCLVLGPGSLQVMHTVDEWIAADDLHAAVPAYEAVLDGLLATSAAAWHRNGASAGTGPC